MSMEKMMAKGTLTRTSLAERDEVAEGLARTDNRTGTENYRRRVGRDEEPDTGAQEAQVIRETGVRLTAEVVTRTGPMPDPSYVNELSEGVVQTHSRGYTAKPSDTLLKAKDAKNSAFRTTMQLRSFAEKLGINPVHILLMMSAGLAPKYKAVRHPDGSTTMIPEITPEGNDVYVAMTPTEQLVAAKEASKYLYPQLKSVELGKDLTDGTVADENVNKALTTFANIARIALGPGNHKVVQIEASEDDEDEE